MNRSNRSGERAASTNRLNLLLVAVAPCQARARSQSLTFANAISAWQNPYAAHSSLLSSLDEAIPCFGAKTYLHPLGCYHRYQPIVP